MLPVDPYVEDRFSHRVKDLEETVFASGADLALIGVEPTYPSAKYGYIVPSSKSSDSDYLRVSHFTEKPTEEKAAELIEQGALWNSGVFAFELDYIISLTARKRTSNSI